MSEFENRKKISIISPTYNEVANVEEIYRRVFTVIDQYPQYDFEYLIIDNASTDGTIEKLKEIAKLEKRFKLIINARNFGHIRSPYWGILQTNGDATIYLASDLQDPPELIPAFIEKWEKGALIVLAEKPQSYDSKILHLVRTIYYKVLDKISDVKLTHNTTGFGLYDKHVIATIKEIGDPYPYLRGLICEIGYPIETIEFKQPRRARGFSKNNIGTLYDIAILGIVSHSLVPIRLAMIFGFLMGIGSILVALIFLVLKLIFWQSFPIGAAPIVISMFFMFGILFMFIGLLGEYIGSIHNYVQNRPIVVERERINF